MINYSFNKPYMNYVNNFINKNLISNCNDDN
jgi:hypothetical protein